MLKVLIAPLIIVSLSTATSAFVASQCERHGRLLIAVHAKGKKPSKRDKTAITSGSVSQGAGFGAASALTKKVTRTGQAEYAAFPALEPEVQKTLLPFEGDKNSAATDLPTDIYERLAHVYGFHSFNYLADSEDLTGNDMETTISFEDLIASTARSESESSLPLQDFGDLLRVVSEEAGGDGSLQTAIATDKDPLQDLGISISKLPPFEKFKILHVDPLVVSVEDFFTDGECDRYIAMSEAPPSHVDSPLQSRSKTVGKDVNAQSQRTSTTWFHHYKAVPELMAKASRLFGLDSCNQFEEPQTVRYRRSEKFTWHLDALAPGSDAVTQAGQRTATLLVYLTDLDSDDGGATIFRDLFGRSGRLEVRPQKGSALFFFPAAGGIEGQPIDIRTLHCGEAVAEHSKQDKWIAQLWLRTGSNQPTAPPGNTHLAATDAIAAYCDGTS